MRVRKVLKSCPLCHESVPARYRALFDLWLCVACFARAQADESVLWPLRVRTEA